MRFKGFMLDAIESKEEYVELAKKRCRTDLKAIDEFS